MRSFFLIGVLILTVRLVAAPSLGMAAGPGKTYVVSTRTPREAAQAARLGQVVHQAESFAVIRSSTLSEGTRGPLSIREVDNRLYLGAYAFDPIQDSPTIPSSLRAAPRSPDRTGFHLIQFHGPPSRGQIRKLQANGVQVIQYVPSNAYLVRASGKQISVAGRAARARWSGPVHPAYKISPDMGWALGLPVRAASGAGVRLAVGIYADGDVAGTLRQIRDLGGKIGAVVQPGRLYLVVADVLLDAARLEAAARLDGVAAIQPLGQPVLRDEVANQILAGNYTNADDPLNTGTDVRFPGYQGFLDGIPTFGGPPIDGSGVTVGVVDDGMNPSAYPIGGSFSSKVADTNRIEGVDVRRGALAVPTPPGSFTPPAPEPAWGHGHFCAGLIAGNPLSLGIPDLDQGGFILGQGVAPGADLIDLPVFRMSYGGDLMGIRAHKDIVETRGLDLATREFGVIANNSWNETTPSLNYNILEAAYDAIVMDASPGDGTTTPPGRPGAQPLTVIFSGSDRGAGGFGSPFFRGFFRPSTAKNVITVGATQSFRVLPPPAQAVDISAFPNYTDRGPVPYQNNPFVQSIPERRVKPDVVAPGDWVISGNAGPPTFGQPISQLHRYGRSTSFAAAHVSGAAALIHQWWRQRQGSDPSPALVKALLINQAVNLFDPGVVPYGPREGWGRVRLDRIFEPSEPGSRLSADYVDQTATLLNVNDTFSRNYVVSDPRRPVRVTLVWTDPPAAVNTSFPISDITNNLDLQVQFTSPTGTLTYQGNRFAINGDSFPGGAPDARNNVEQVVLSPLLPVGQTGSFQVSVRAAALTADGNLNVGLPLSGGGTPDQHFALVVHNATPAPATGEFEFTATPALLAVPQNSPRSFNLRTVPFNNLAGPIDFTTNPAAPIPFATQFVLAPPFVPATGVFNSFLIVEPSSATPLGFYNFDIIATDRATGLQHTQPVTVRVTNFNFGIGCRDESPPLPIPDNNPTFTESRLTFTDDINIQDIEVSVNISHPFIGDLEVEIEHPDGTRVLLHDETGEGAVDLVTSYPNLTTPAQPLSALFNKRSQGVWKLRVRDLNPGDIGAINQFCLRIDGPDFSRVSVIAPNGGERWDIGSVQRIRWSNDPTNPLTGDVRVELSRDGGTTFTTLTTLPVDVEFFDFAVTGPVTTQALVRVSLVSDPTQQFDVSDAVFSILNPFITVQIPNGGEQARVGVPFDIQWDSVPRLPGETVKIELSRDGGVTFPTIIADAAPNTGSFLWQPSVGQDSSQARIRITANSSPARSDESDANFTIFTPDLAVLEPNGGDIWYVSTQRTIRFLAAGVTGPVRVELSRDSARNDWVTLGIVSAAAGQLVWTVTGPTTTSALVRVTSINDPAKTDVSDAPFEIRDIRITVTEPQAGVRWAIGSTFDIRWNTEGLPNLPTGTDNVDIDISRDGGPFLSLFRDTPNDGVEPFLVTAPESTNCVIRVRARNFTGEGRSSVFSILKPFVRVAAPNGGEKVAIGRPFEIRWDAVPGAGDVSIRLSRDSGVSYPTIITSNAPNTGSFFWTPAAGLDTTTARIQVSVNGSPFPTQTDTSDGDFTIETPAISVTAPAAGDVFYIATTRTIRYTTIGLSGGVNIDVRRNGGPLERLFSNVPTSPSVNDNARDWVVTGPATTSAVIRVTAVDDPGLFAESEVFEIRPIAITVVRPNGGETWGVGTTHTITWTTFGLPAGMSNVNIAITRDAGAGGATFTDIATDVPSTDGGALNSFTWTVTGPPSSECVIRVSASAFPAFDVSDVTFSIVDPAITVISPNGGEELRVGQSHTVAWVPSGFLLDDGTSGNVHIELRRSPAAAWETVAASAPNTGTFNFTVTGPDTVGATAEMRVTAVELPAVSDTSDAPFTIVTPRLRVLRPNNGERFFVGETEPITWTSQGLSGDVRIELTRNGGATWETLFAAASNDGRRDFTVTGPGATNCRVRISSLTNPAVSDESDGPFSIVQPSLRVGTPNGGEEFLVGSVQTVTWTSLGVTSGVHIDLVYTDGTVVRLATDTPNDGSEPFTVPAPGGRTARIRVTWAANPGVTDESDGPVTISAPTLEVTSPGQGTRRVRVGDRLTITWTGSVVRSGGGTVDIFVSRNGGNTFPERIIADTANDGITTWLVSGPNSRKVKVRVVWKPDPAVADASDGVFQISGRKSTRR